MLKGLKKLIFNTDIDDISEEGTVTEIELPKKEKAEALMETPLKEIEKADVSSPEEKKPFTGIDADYKKPVQPEKKGNETLLQRKETKQETNAEFEFRPVLSPIYGNTADEEKKKQKIHDAVHLPKSKTKNPLNTVLSPMYGEFELENFEKEAKQKLQERRVQKELHIEPSLISDADDEDENLSLDQMLTKDGADENEPVQISLFGESTPIKDVAAKEETVFEDEE